MTAGPLLLAYAGAIFYVIKQADKGHGSNSAFVLALPMPFVSAMYFVYSLGAQAVLLITPDSENFSSECKVAGAQYMKAPASPVRSVAYYSESKFSPHFTLLTTSWGTRISTLGYRSPPDLHPEISTGVM